MTGIKTTSAIFAAISLMCLVACEARHTPRSSEAAAPTGPSDRSASQAPAAYAAAPRVRREPPPDYHGKPLWADNRRGTAEENARYQFQHRGVDVGAKSFDDYLTKVHAFFEHPPTDLETATRPSNGDLLVYSPSQNLFGVIRKDGAPRLLMKPPTGRAYWEEQRNQTSELQSRESATR